MTRAGSWRRRRERQVGELTDRSRLILASLVRAYIDRGEPVSSLWLARHGGFGLSSATVRHTMVELERRGYVRQPHTSSGRVPTDLAYRCYVDLLLRGRRPARLSPNVEARLRRATTVDDLLANVSQELSRVSHHMGFALVTPDDRAAFRHIDFVALDRTWVLVVLVSAAGQVSHKVVELDDQTRPSDLVQAANYLNAEFAGLPLSEVRETIRERLHEERTLYDALLSTALRLACATFTDMTPRSSLFVQGASLLLDEKSQGEDRVSMATLRALLDLIEEKDRLVRLLNEYIDSPGLTIIIGGEHRAPGLQNFSLIATTYVDGQQTGCLGILGPRRMRYARTIAAVDSVSRTMSRLLDTHGGTAWTN